MSALEHPTLVTGGAGFIGSHLVERLIQNGAKVRILDDLSSGRLENLESVRSSPLLEFTEGSVCDVPLVSSLARDCGRIFHLAASVGVAMITARPGECLRNNVEGVQSVLAAASASGGVSRVVLFSSSEVYGKSEAIPLREDGDLLLGPSHIARWSYASGKVVGEFLALAESRRSGLPVTVVRCFNTCGPRQRASYGMVMPRLCDQALAGEPLTVYGDGEQSRCFSYVEDVVEQVLRLSTEAAAAGEVYNIGTDRETTVNELASRILDLTGRRSTIRRVPYREAYGDDFQDVRRRVPDLSKLRRLFGGLPDTGLDQMLAATLRFRAGLRAVPAPR